MITIVLVEDNATLRFILKDLLENEPDFSIVDVVATGTSALKAVRTLYPNVVILDIRLPDINGLDMIPLVKQRSPETQIIIHSLHDEQAYRRKALNNGAADFILKSDSIDALKAAIRSVVLAPNSAASC
jgi:DNA-binding NarL/FixJ family response regulator